MTSGWQQYPSKSAGFTSDARWQRVRRQVLKRDDHQCQIRGPRCTTDATAVDKIISAARGGDPFDADNLQAVCNPCHASKTAAEALAGRSVSRRKRRSRVHPSDVLGGQP